MTLPYPLEALAGLRTHARPAVLRRAWPLAAAIVVIAVVMAGLACSRHGRPAMASALFLPDMLLDLPVRPVTWLTPDPEVERLFINYGDDRILADIYRPPGDGPHPTVIFSMGAPPLDLDDARLVKLAEDAARAGMVMVVPFSERLDEERILPEEVDALAGVFLYLEGQPYVDPERIGYIGVSVGGSIALVAASEPEISERVHFVVAFGAYYDGLDTLVAAGSRHMAYDGLEESWEPDEHVVEVLALQLIDELPAAQDRATLCKAFVDAWDYDLCDAPGGPGPVTEAGLAALTAEGRAAYDLMTSGDPALAQSLLEELPPSALEKLERLSPSRSIDRLRARVFIVHDRGDAFVPYVESRRLRDALAGRSDVHFTEVALFEHVEPRLGRGGEVVVIDGVRLYFRLYQLLLLLS